MVAGRVEQGRYMAFDQKVIGRRDAGFVDLFRVGDKLCNTSVFVSHGLLPSGDSRTFVIAVKVRRNCFPEVNGQKQEVCCFESLHIKTVKRQDNP